MLKYRDFFVFKRPALYQQRRPLTQRQIETECKESATLLDEHVRISHTK